MNTDTNKNKDIHIRKLEPVPLLDGIEEIKQDFEERIEQGDVTYGVEILDDCVETIRKGSTTFIIAAPNSGKSLLGQYIAENLARQGKLVMICSCEMGAGLLMERQIKKIAGVTNKELKRLYEDRRDTANKIMDDLIVNDKYSHLQNISICETGGATVYDIIDLMDCFPEFQYIVIDYIQRIRGVGTEYEIITNAARELQTYARQTGKCFIVCSQASRVNNDTYNNKDNTNKNVNKIRGKGSGSIEEDADVGLSLLADNKPSGEKFLLMTLFKNRYGSKKDITYKYRLDDRLNLTLQQRGCYE